MEEADLVLDLGLHVLDGVACLHFEGDGLPGECLHEDLHLGISCECRSAERVQIRMEGRLKVLDNLGFEAAKIRIDCNLIYLCGGSRYAAHR